MAAVAAAAAFDSLRGPPAPVPAALRGELVYSDADCHRHGIRLPDLARRDFLTVGCGVFTRLDSLGVRDGVVAWFAYPVPGGTTTLLRSGDIREVAWLGGRRFAAVARGGLTIWLGDRLLRTVASGAFRDLRASPSGRYFAAVGADGLSVFDRTGRRLELPAGHVIAWSPGERFAAVGRGDDVEVVPAGGGDPLVRIPLAATDLDWRRG